MLHRSNHLSSKYIDRSKVPTLDEKDLEEQFVRGSGPGGQSVNKTSSACSLKHIPTGFVVKCHEDRSLHRNRTTARKLLISKLDDYYNGEMSVSSQLKKLANAKRTKAQQKHTKREEMKRAWREREGLD
ncbi:hypothetical protein Pmani_029554 [Petrolisthes manimaculis]|uniref:Prokaryotic-type class I peptide chain release factors domain-containing protein n=1 Tax=Petrolisthes manimaculis TaxID=1843537 RepID=A0AAE1NXD2_9EUCA|nr:hypothetical protein Pmani_029554 [Petrolisthes manimaculis]